MNQIPLEDMKSFRSVRELADEYGLSRAWMAHYLSQWDYEVPEQFRQQFRELPDFLSIPDLREWTTRKGWWIPDVVLRKWQTVLGRKVLNRQQQMSYFRKYRGLSVDEAWERICELRKGAGLPRLPITAFHYRLTIG